MMKKFLNTAMSQLLIPGPRRMLRPEVQKTHEQVGECRRVKELIHTRLEVARIRVNEVRTVGALGIEDAAVVSA